MNYQDNSITSQGSGYEQAFIQAIYDYILALDNRITCDTTVEAQYGLTTGKPTFNFSFNGHYILTFIRENDITSSNPSYRITYILNGAQIKTTVAFNTNITLLNIKSFIGNNICLLFLRVTSTNEWQPMDIPFSVGCVTDGNNNYFGGANDSTDLLSAQFYKLSDYTSGYYFAKMINFAAPAGNIGYSSIAPFSNGGSLAFYVSEILSCSTVNQFITINLPNGKNYLSIGSNAMVEISA